MKIYRAFFIICILVIITLSCKSKGENNLPSIIDDNIDTLSLENTLFKSGDNGYACFRIPAIVTTQKGSVLAFAEARKNGCSDTGNIDLVMRKSLDNGQTWSPLKIIWDDGNNVCGNPSPVVDESTGNIHLLATWNDGNDHESKIIEGTSTGTREVFHLVSKDDGNSWSIPNNITKSVKLPSWTWYATGPVHGIQLKSNKYKGRLVIPCDYIEARTKKKYSHVIYSDNQGETWEIGGIAPKHQVNESTVVELKSGNLLFNMRNYDRDSIQGRQIAMSKDGGETWLDQYIEKQLPEPVCQGALLNIERDNNNILLFSNPSSNSSRTNMTISVSRNEGKSWDEKISIYKKHAAYSDMTELTNEKILICYEAGIDNAYEGIYYKTIDLE